ncbi:hypothetical protein HOLleu_33140 [Holothuria leucospilota]|uniref:Uncharacterized protein n=1 Tax=Holothuria leucospilota TaxID=206669 RepID=A0A9Q1BF78_HOLLE|nr:hypothetical protein HOLleu_33140 [Holothuria leucospilota]
MNKRTYFVLQHHKKNGVQTEKLSFFFHCLGWKTFPRSRTISEYGLLYLEIFKAAGTNIARLVSVNGLLRTFDQSVLFDLKGSMGVKDISKSIKKAAWMCRICSSIVILVSY